MLSSAQSFLSFCFVYLFTLVDLRYLEEASLDLYRRVTALNNPWCHVLPLVHVLSVLATARIIQRLFPFITPENALLSIHGTTRDKHRNRPDRTVVQRNDSKVGAGDHASNEFATPKSWVGHLGMFSMTIPKYYLLNRENLVRHLQSVWELQPPSVVLFTYRACDPYSDTMKTFIVFAALLCLSAVSMIFLYVCISPVTVSCKHSWLLLNLGIQK